MKHALHTATTFCLALIAGIALLAPTVAQGQINYQGRLTDSVGAPLPDGPRNIQFTLWTTLTGGAVPIWGPFILDGGSTTGHGPQADLVGGRFNVIIGGVDTTGNSLTAALANIETYLEIQVGTDTPITPRQIILAAPRALRADVIPNVTPNASGVDITGNATVTGNTIIDGKVGIGNSAPGFPLSMSNDVGDKISLNGFAAGGASYGFGIQSLLLQIHSAASNGDIAFGHGSSASMVELVRIKGNGRVGIGTASPSTALHVSSAVSTEISVDSTAASGRRYTLQSGNTGRFAVIDRTAGVSRFSVESNGNVGIGGVATKAKLEISGGFPGVVNIGGFLNRYGASDLSNSDQARDYSLYCSSVIVGSEIFANSDARIKNIKGHSDGAADLATLSRIEITDYIYKDVIGQGSHPQKKVIAQQVEKVYPQAVSQHTDVVPDIYQKAEVKDGWVKLATNLKEGERVRLIGEKKEGVHEVLEVAEGRFRTDFSADGDNVFVYGREVNDFRAVDYQAIAMLNVSATQELAKQLEEKTARVATLEQEVAALKQMFVRLAATVSASKSVAATSSQNAPFAELEFVKNASSTVPSER